MARNFVTAVDTPKRGAWMRPVKAARFVHHNHSMVTLTRKLSRINWVFPSDYTALARSAIAGATLLVWALAAGSLVYWGLRLSAGRDTVAPPPPQVTQASADPFMVARLLGARAASPMMQASLASRLALQGVVAGGPGGGAALLAVDGKPAKPYRVGTVVDDGVVLKSVTARGITLADAQTGAALLSLDMPLPK